MQLIGRTTAPAPRPAAFHRSFTPPAGHFAPRVLSPGAPLLVFTHTHVSFVLRFTVKFLARFHRHLPWFNLPAVALVALLQRTPVLRVAAVAESVIGASSAGQVLRSVFTAAASLGAMHSLAGATVLITNSPSPLAARVGVAVVGVGFGINGPGVGQPESWVVGGSIPPGLNFSGLTAPGTVNISSLVLTGTPTASGTYPVTLQGWQNRNRSGSGSPIYSYVITVAAAANVLPSFSLQPVSRTAVVGNNVTFSANAAGTPLPTFQWRKDGVAIAGATALSLTLTNVQLSQAGTYSVVATNAAGTATSNAAALTVTPPAAAAPTFTTQPAPQTVSPGDTVVFNSAAPTATAYRWQRNGVDLAAATSANLVLKSVAAADVGSYRVLATNSAGTVTSSAALLTVNAAAATDLGRLINLSILTTAGPGPKVLTVGAVVGPLNFTGALPLVIRAVGPTLNTAFGLGGVLPDPVLTLNRSGVAAPVAANDNWGGDASLRTAFAAVGAFDLPAASRDSAALSSASPGGYTVQVTGQANASGLVIAEIYDASTGRTAASPRLINLSTLTEIDAGATLAVGFVLRGATSRTVLVRGVGPSLGTIFGLGGVMADPKLELFNNDTGAKITENDNWGGDAQLMDAAASVGAFALADIGTKDAVLLVTLAPGAYSARVSGVGPSAGTAIIEVYELP